MLKLTSEIFRVLFNNKVFMFNLFKKIRLLIFISSLFGISAINFPAYSQHFQWIMPPISYPAPALCPYTHSSTCSTYSGGCSLFVTNPHPTWFSTCLEVGFFYTCVNLQTFPVPFVQNACYLKGTPCTCSFGFINGFYTYEHGIVL